MVVEEQSDMRLKPRTVMKKWTAVSYEGIIIVIRSRCILGNERKVSRCI